MPTELPGNPGSRMLSPRFSLLLLFIALAAPPLARANTPPVANPDSYHAPVIGQTIALNVLANDTDVDANPLTIIALSAFPQGTIAIVNNQVQLTLPKAGVIGSVRFSYTVSDGAGGTASATVTISNSAPIPTSDLFVAFAGANNGSLHVLDNDKDPDKDALTLKRISGPSGAVISGNKIAFLDKPILSELLRTDLTYEVSDERGGTSTAGFSFVPLLLAAPTRVGAYGATVHARASFPKSTPVEVTYYIDYGLTANYGRKTSRVTRTLSPDAPTLSATLPDLLPGNVYHYSFFVIAGGRICRSQDGTFVTSPFSSKIALYGSRAADARIVAYASDGTQKSIDPQLGGRPIVAGNDGNLYTSSRAGSIYRIGADGTLAPDGEYASELTEPSGLAFGDDGTLFVATRAGATTSQIQAIALDRTRRPFGPPVPLVSELTVAPDGSLFCAPVNPGPITIIEPAGKARTVAPELQLSRSVVAVPLSTKLFATSPTRNAIYSVDDALPRREVASAHGKPRALAAFPALGGDIGFLVATDSGSIQSYYVPNSKGSPSSREFAFDELLPDHLTAAPRVSLQALPVVNFSSSKAELRGRVVTAGKRLKVYFRLGFRLHTAAVELGPSLAVQEFSVIVERLKPGALFESRVEAVDLDAPDQFYGPDSTVLFTTATVDSRTVPDTFHLRVAAAPYELDVLKNDVFFSTDPLTITGVTQGSFGHVQITGNRLRYTLTSTSSGSLFQGDDSFTYTTTDAFGGTATVAVVLRNGPPTAEPDVVAVRRGASIVIHPLDNDFDPDGDALTLTAVGAAQYGTVTKTGQSVIYERNPSYLGSDTFTYTVSDGYGRSSTGVVEVVLPSTAADLVVVRGAQVAEFPAGATFASFGVPTINDDGVVAFTANVRGLQQNQRGIFVLRPNPSDAGYISQKVALIGDLTPSPARARFTALGHPVLDASGSVAFFAAMSAANGDRYTGIYSNAELPHDLRMLYSYLLPPGVGGVPTVTGLALTANGRVIFTDDPPTARATLYIQAPDGFVQGRLRIGDTLQLPSGERKLTRLALFGALTGTADARRGFNSLGGAVFRAGFADGGEALLRADAERGLLPIVESEDAGAFGLPVMSDSGLVYVHTRDGIDAYAPAEDPVQPVARKTVAAIGKFAPGVPGANQIPFVTLGDPVANADGDLAFLGAVKVAPPIVTTENNSGVWFGRVGQIPRMIVRKGDPAPGLRGGEFTTFTSLVLPGPRGIAFVANAAVSTDPAGAAPTRGLWATDRHGALQLLLRTGAPVPALGRSERRVRDFDVLSAVPIAASQGRTANATGGFAARIIYEDGAEAIVTLWVP